MTQHIAQAGLIGLAASLGVAVLLAAAATGAKRYNQSRPEGNPMDHDLDPPTVRGLALAPQDAAEPPAAVPAPPRLTGWAQTLHDRLCGCEDGGDIPGHGGTDYQAIADEFQANMTAALTPAMRYPVETKVWAGALGALGASVGLALVTLLLGRLDLIPSLLGDSPWTGALVLVLSVVLPPVASFIRGYLAEHSPRPVDVAAPVEALAGKAA